MSRSEQRWLAAVAVLGAVFLILGLRTNLRQLDSEIANALSRVEQREVLRVAVRRGPTTFFEVDGREQGLEFELLRAFADHLGVRLQILSTQTVSQALASVARRRADIAAGTLSPQLDESRFALTQPFREVALLLVGNERGRLENAVFAVPKTLARQPAVRAFQADHPDATFRSAATTDPVALFDSLEEGNVDAAVMFSHQYTLHEAFHPRFVPLRTLGEAIPLVFATHGLPDRTLADAIDAFLSHPDTAQLIDDLEYKYFGHLASADPEDTRYLVRHIRERLLPLKPMFEDAAQQTGFDWRLLAAMAYQESLWDPDAVSPTGVRGIMMLTEATANELGVDRTSPEQSILAGARYLRDLYQRLPERIEDPDRLWLALAAYNVGMGHLEDARILAQSAGLDPDRWRDVARHLPRLSDPNVYPRTRNGFARGSEPVRYVRRVRSFRDALQWKLDQWLASPSPDRNPEHASERTVVLESTGGTDAAEAASP